MGLRNTIFAVMSVSSGRGAEQAAQRRECVRAAEIVPALLSVPIYSFVVCLTDA